MTSKLEYLLSLRDADERYDIAPAELLPMQLDAANELLETRVDQIPLLKNRADGGAITKINEAADLVPLLFAHNTYKTYAEPWLTEGQWDRMAKWLQTVSTYEVGGSSYGDVDSLDGWIDRLEGQAWVLACSSGTTGKPAMLASADHDVDFAGQANISAFSWATGIKPAQDRKYFGLGPHVKNTRNRRTREAMVAAYGLAGEAPYQLPTPEITIGSVVEMILLRRKIADGTAQPSEVAEFESLSAERQTSLDEAAADAIDALVKFRDEKLLLTGFFPHIHPLATGVRELGYSGQDFSPENAMLTGGGLKGAQLPPDYREFIFGTFNLSEQHVYHMYSMQEINTPFPRCSSGRYHVAPWVMALPLDEPGEQLLDAGNGEIEARAAFLDLSLEGRWGGVISGDRVNIDFAQCACGRQGPTVGPDIVRYADLEGGDKITCAGTIDAYVRGAA